MLKILALMTVILCLPLFADPRCTLAEPPPLPGEAIQHDISPVEAMEWRALQAEWRALQAEHGLAQRENIEAQRKILSIWTERMGLTAEELATCRIEVSAKKIICPPAAGAGE